MSNVPDYASGTKPTWRDTYGWPLGVLGQLAAGAAGTYLYSIVRQQNFVAPFLVGVCVGFGGRAVSNKGGPVLAVLAAGVALGGSVVGEWMGAPFLANPSLRYFVKHVHTLPHLTIGLHVAGALVAGWIAWAAPKRG